MSYTIKKPSAEPIVIITWSNSFSYEDFMKSCEEVEKLRPPNGKIVRIDNVQGLNMSFSSAVSGIGIVRTKVPGSPTDSNVKPLLVGEGVLWNMVSVAAKRVSYGAGVEVPIFDSVDDAVKVGKDSLGP